MTIGSSILPPFTNNLKLKTMSQDFTMQDAMNVQLEQITRWAKVLNTDAYLMLLKGIAKKNAKGYKSPYDVFRGNDIDMFIHNEIMNKL